MATKKISKISDIRPIIRIIPALLLMSAIFYLSSHKTPILSNDFVFNFAIFKSIHVAVYFTLFCAWYLYTINGKNGIILSYLYAMTDEFHQTFVPGREGCLRDTAIDLFGIMIAFVVVKIISHYFPKVFS